MLFACGITARPKIDKHRDKLRFGYGDVSSVKVYTIDGEGERHHTSTDVFCNLAGDMKCRSNTVIVTDPTYELDIFNEDYTLAERIIAEGILVDGDTKIENGQVFINNTKLANKVHSTNRVN